MRSGRAAQASEFEDAFSFGTGVRCGGQDDDGKEAQEQEQEEGVDLDGGLLVAPNERNDGWFEVLSLVGASAVARIGANLSSTALYSRPYLLMTFRLLFL